ncbi:MAG: MurR/RpiR family transcriptional regulator [Mesorhizobium sp.]|nr:MurR/RpiR family transcriptional regulator [Mesorhizobium sp.]
MALSIAEIITDRLTDMPARERRAAQALIANYPMLGLKTVAEFAQRGGVSSPTILRLVARLGYQNYAEFQSALNDELAARLQSPLSRTGRARSSREGEPAPLLSAMLQNISETFRIVSAKQIGEIVAVLSDPKRRIHLVGGRFTDPIARYAAAHLAIIRPGVVHLDGQENLWRDRLIDMGRRDVLLLFDIRRYQDSLLQFAEKAHARGVSIVLVTDQWLSPIARFANHVIAARTSVPSAWDSSAGLFILAEHLIAGVTERLPEQSAARIRDMDALRRE